MYRVAIVDDEPLIREALSKYISESDLECEVCLEARGARDVIDYLEEQTIDIMLLDINMPGIDGLTLAGNLNAMGCEIHIIIVSAHKEFNYVKKAFNIGVVDYLAKPIRDEEVHLVLEKVIQQLREEENHLITGDLNYFYELLKENSNSDDEDWIDEVLNNLMIKIEVYSNGDFEMSKMIVQDICVNVLKIYSFYDRKIEGLEIMGRTIEAVQGATGIEQLRQAILILNDECKAKMNYIQYSQLIQDALIYIKSNYKDEITLQSVADFLAVNSSYLSRLLKKEVEKTFSDLVLEERMEMAKVLLKNPRMRLNEIANEIGYKEYAYFYQVFRKSQGLTPMEYRNSQNI